MPDLTVYDDVGLGIVIHELRDLVKGAACYETRHYLYGRLMELTRERDRRLEPPKDAA